MGGPITEAVLETLRERRVVWVARYLRLDTEALDEHVPGGDHQGCYSLSRAELARITDAGMLVLPVQWGPGHETLTADLGEQRGRLAVAQARALGLPSGIHLWCDIEGGGAYRSGGPACRDYVTAWARAVTDGAYRAGLYVGDAAVPLDGADLYSLPRVTSYWRSATSGGPDEPYPRRGWAIHQSPPMSDPMLHDPDVMHPDALGEMPVLAGTEAARLALWAEAQRRLAEWWITGLISI